jgi:hypothetical protein
MTTGNTGKEKGVDVALDNEFLICDRLQKILKRPTITFNASSQRC